MKKRTQREDWFKLSPLLYTYLSSIRFPEFASFSGARFVKQESKSSSFKYETFKSIIGGKNSSDNGLLIITQIQIPFLKDLDDNRLKYQLTPVNEIIFETEVTLFEQISLNIQQAENLESYVLLCERKHPDIFLFEMNSMRKNSYPRITLKGHASPVTALKSRYEQVLTANSQGEIKLFNLRNGSSQAPLCYNYHRKEVTDCCWLSNQSNDNKFISCSTEGLIYIWDKRESLPCQKIDPKQSEVLCLQLLKENCFLSGGEDGSIRFYDIRFQNNKYFIFREHTSGVKNIRKMEAKPQSNHEISFVSGARNGEVILWSEEAQFVHLNHSREIRDISYDKNAELFMTTQCNSSSICLWKPSIYNYQ